MKFKNGAEHDDGKVRVFYNLLRHLMQEDTILFYELVMHCRKPDHVFFADTKEELMRLRWLDIKGRANAITKEIVMEFVSGDGIHMEMLPYNGG